VDIEKIIEELRAERERVSETILAIERLHYGCATSAVKRRGRKFMDQNGRKEVSERMKRYWAGRRKEKAAQPAEAARDSKPKRGGSASGGTSRTSEASSIGGARQAAA
jgi:hypothetical protein